MARIGRLEFPLVGRWNLHPVADWGLRYLTAALAAKGYQVTVVSGFRSYADQKRLHTTRKGVLAGAPVAVPGLSPHNYGFGFDLNIAPATGFAVAGAMWESMGGRWGGRFKDRVHFDIVPNWPTVAPLFKRACGLA